MRKGKLWPLDTQEAHGDGAAGTRDPLFISPGAHLTWASEAGEKGKDKGPPIKCHYICPLLFTLKPSEVKPIATIATVFPVNRLCFTLTVTPKVGRCKCVLQLNYSANYCRPLFAVSWKKKLVEVPVNYLTIY